MSDIPAFPQGIAGTTDGGTYTGFEKHPDFGGMTLRDYFAAKAMAAMLCPEDANSSDGGRISATAYRYADTMMKERESK